MALLPYGMKNEDIEQKTIRSYLIGNTDEATAEALDALSIADQDFADRITAEQYELVDDWVAGQLNPTERAAFGAVLARSPTLIEKVKVSKLMAATPRVAVVERSTGTGFFAGLFSGMPRLAYGLAGVVLLLGAVAAILIFVRKDSSPELTRVETPVNVLPTNFPVVPTVPAPTAEPPTPLPANGSRPDNSNGRKPPPQPTRTATRSLVALVLSPPTRGAGEIKSVKLEPGVEYLELSVQTEAQNSGRFVVEVADDSSGKVEWRSAAVRGRLQKGRTVVFVRVPSTRLRKGLWTIRLREADPPSEVIDEHSIRIDH